MITNTDEDIKKIVDQELNDSPITIELLKSLGHTVYEFNPQAVCRTVTICINYKHPRKYGYFKERYGKLQDEIRLYGKVSEQGNITIKTVVYVGNQSIGVILNTVGDLKKYMDVRLTEEKLELEMYRLRKVIETIEIPF